MSTPRGSRALPSRTADLARPAAVRPGERARKAYRDTLKRTAPVLAGLLGLGLLALLAGALVPSGPLLVAGGVLVPLVAVRLLGLLVPGFPWQRDVARAQVQLVLALADALLLVGVLRDRAPATGVQVALVVAFAALQLLRTVLWALQLLDGRQQDGRSDARGLTVALPPLPARPRLLVQGGPAAVAVASALPALALLAVLLGGPEALLPVAAAAGALVVLAVVVLVAPTLLEHARATSGGRRVRAVHEAVTATEPVVVLYTAGEADDLFWVTQWLDTLEHLDRPSVVLFRDPDSFDLAPPSSVPYVCLPNRFDIGPFALPSATVALYVATGAENNRLLRSRELRHAFIGHGDSDKGVSASPLMKAFDEVWVAGEAGRRRFEEAAVGVRADEVRVVGRPQARRVQRARPRAAGERFAVLYAPSWEGVERKPYESSLLHSGRELVARLLARDDVRLVYRPHPKTGERNPAFVAQHAEIVRMIEQAGAPHEVDRPHESDLIDRFNDVDALVPDLSGVLSDFLASDKPYFVVNATGVPDEEFRAANPSTGGAYLLGTGGEGLEAALDEAMSADGMRARRRATRVALIGPPADDAVQPFRDAVDALGATLRGPAAHEVAPAR